MHFWIFDVTVVANMHQLLRSKSFVYSHRVLLVHLYITTVHTDIDIAVSYSCHMHTPSSINAHDVVIVVTTSFDSRIDCLLAMHLD